ncbi:hypothetical protein [Candidatus Methylomicrobium oryzae]|uniref:hypothetical protein n=1 Tax=Candidatus Methylomicrobium oryzae TaxID=2802053 RepID=UPI0019229D61|nr:hypothetical protein [Methylomicrobium sp. RS1]MBL1265149.1 hypothetical protein [Methylomicrobium sp. RS1]
MKYWLSAVLLANIALLLVEFHSGAFESFLMEEASDLRKERETYSSKHPDASGGSGRADTPVSFAEKSSEDLNPHHEARPKIEQTPPQDTISIPDAPAVPSSSNLIQTPVQTGTPPLGSGSADVPENKPLAAVGFPHPAELPPAQPPASPEPSKAPIAIQSTEKGSAALFTSAPIPLIPAAEKNVSAAPEIPQKNGKSGSAQPALHSEKSGKTETPAQSAKNKNAGNESLAKETHPPSPLPHNLDKVLTACYMAGPADSVEALNALLSQFRPQLTELAMSPAQAEKVRKGNRFVVYYPAPPSMEESLLTATTLKNTYGLKDLQVIRDGEMKGAISLGVFSSQRNAEWAKSKFEQQGLQVRIKPRFPTGNAYKVRMRWTTQQEPIAERLVDALTQSYPDTQRISSCE